MAPTPHDIHHIPLTEIDADALPRDRTTLDDGALHELALSIAANGLRQPIEVFATNGDTDHPYGLISGFRRLAAHRHLDLPTIPAFLRAPADGAAAMASMIEENEIRADISPWERGRIALTAIDAGLFETLDDAIPRLFPTYDRFRQTRLRSVAEVVAHFGEHALTDPRGMSQNQFLRLAAALRMGLGDVMDVALGQSSDRSAATQWRLLGAIMDEAETEARAPALRYKKGRPRRYIRPQQDLVVRREQTRDGWSLHFTGKNARGPLMEDIMDYVEDMFGDRQR